MRVSIVKILSVGLLWALLSMGSSLAATHKVQRSETFYSIATKYGVSVSSLMSTNGVKDPRHLQLGQTLKIPSKTSSRSASASRTSHSKSVSRSLRVVLDPGHGGRDRGAVWGGIRESDLNIKVATRAESYLKARGYKVVLTRRSDVYVSLSRRAQISNQYSNSIFISIHFNATKYTSVRGAETYYAGTRGRYLAQAIQKEMVSKLKVRNRGTRYRRFTVLRQTSSPAVLVECGFISNSSERSRCVTSSYQSLAAQAIVAGVEKYDRAY
ncbi:N-acetylmuramoyl-L-alanine amidase [Verrucomicrobiaceae bacterium 227]